MHRVLALLLALTFGLCGPAAADMATATGLAKAKTFVANGTVPCAQEVGQTLGQCDANVARADGSAAVLVTFKNGFTRMLMFSGGDFIRGNATMSGVGTDTDWSLSDGIFSVRVDDQRFELPEALVFGD